MERSTEGLMGSRESSTVVRPGAGSASVDSPGSIQARGTNVTVNRLTVDLSDRTFSTIAFGVSMFALGIAILGLILGQMSERESRLAQQDAMLLKASMIAHGINVDEDKLHMKEK